MDHHGELAGCAFFRTFLEPDGRLGVDEVRDGYGSDVDLGLGCGPADETDETQADDDCHHPWTHRISSSLMNVRIDGWLPL